MGLLSAQLNYSKSNIRTISDDKANDYAKFPTENVGMLEAKMNMLEARKKDLQRIEHRTNEMEAWIMNVEKHRDEVETRLKESNTIMNESKSKRMQFGSYVKSKLDLVEDLHKQRDKWDSLIPPFPPARNNCPNNYTHELVGFEGRLNEMLDYIKGTDIHFIGIWGACGIGKSTLLEQIKSKFRDNDGNAVAPFARVILVRVNKDPNIERIQNAIAAELKLTENGNANFSELDAETRAEKLLQALSKETFLIMLDDLWKTDDFRQIGIPPPKSGSKIVITTRLKRVCQGLNPKKIIRMTYLNKSDSLELFKATRPCKTNKEEMDANNIVEKCAGLPLALLRVGEGTSDRKLEHAYDLLNNSPTKIKGLKESVLNVVKTSFDELNEEEKSCFLFCVLFPDSKDINLKGLVEYWIGEKLEDESLEQLRRSANDIVEQLIGCCLLEEGADTSYVKMHGIVHSMAVWLVTEDDTSNSYRFEFVTGKELNQSVVKRMEKAKRASLVDVDIKQLLEQIPGCPDLVTLLMGRSGSLPHGDCHISKRFFQQNRMPSIRVLDMKHQPISNLPDQISNLMSLRYLNLTDTSIESLPSALGTLTDMRQLDLTGTLKLKKIPRRALSSNSKLRSLKLYESGYKCIDDKNELSLDTMRSLKSLEELQLPLQKLKTLERLSGFTELSELVTYLQLAFMTDCLHKTQNEVFELLGKFKNLETLSLKSCAFVGSELKVLFRYLQGLETLILQSETASEITFALETKNPSVLRKLHIASCSSLTDITCLCQLQHLEILKIHDCQKISKLLLPPESLQCISVAKCQMLKQMKPDSTGKGRKIEISCEKEWWEELDRDDKSFFRPPF